MVDVTAGEHTYTIERAVAGDVPDLVDLLRRDPLGAAREAVPGDDVLAPDPPPVVGVGAEEAGADPAPRRELPRAGVAAALRSAWVFGRAHAAVIGVIGLVALVGAVWAISQARGEPWPGGHTTHADQVPPGSAKGTSGRVQLTRGRRLPER